MSKLNDIAKKINKFLLWLVALATLGAVISTSHYVIDTYNDNKTCTINYNPKN